MKFVLIDDSSVVLRRKGLYSQVPVYRLGDALYALLRKGVYIAILGNNGTSVPDITHSELDVFPLVKALKDGRIQVVPA